MSVSTQSVKWCSTPVYVPGVGRSGWNTEVAFQIYAVDWLRRQALQFPGDPRYIRWHHSANERTGLQAGLQAKAMGQAAGFPDLIHLGLRLAIELKVPGGKVSPLQADWLSYLQGIGWTAKVVWSFEEFRDLVEGQGRV
jgi:hypothetical protein